MDTITKEELQEMEDMLSGKLMLDDEELLYWLKQDMRKLLTAYTAVMYCVTIREGHEVEGAVAALVKATERAIGQLKERGRNPWTENLLGNALAPFEVDPDTEEL